jgi:hypothetical protein
MAKAEVDLSIDDAIARVKLINSMGDNAYICERPGGNLCVLSQHNIRHWENRDAQVIEICKVAR